MYIFSLIARSSTIKYYMYIFAYFKTLLAFYFLTIVNYMKVNDKSPALTILYSYIYIWLDAKWQNFEI